MNFTSFHHFDSFSDECDMTVLAMEHTKMQGIEGAQRKRAHSSASINSSPLEIPSTTPREAIGAVLRKSLQETFKKPTVPLMAPLSPDDVDIPFDGSLTMTTTDQLVSDGSLHTKQENMSGRLFPWMANSEIV